jgi:hypothetical protein
VIDLEDTTIIGVYGYRTLPDKVPANVRLKVKPFSARHAHLFRVSHLSFDQIQRKPRHTRDDVRILINKNRT